MLEVKQWLLLHRTVQRQLETEHKGASLVTRSHEHRPSTGSTSYRKVGQGRLLTAHREQEKGHVPASLSTDCFAEESFSPWLRRKDAHTPSHPPATQDTSPHWACGRNLNCPESCQEMKDMPTVIKTSVKAWGQESFVIWVGREKSPPDRTHVPPSLI